MSYCAENFSGIPLPIHFKTFQNTKAFGSLFFPSPHPPLCTPYSFKTKLLVVLQIIHAVLCLCAFASIIFSVHILEHLVCKGCSFPLVYMANSYTSFKFLYKMSLPQCKEFLDFLRHT